MKRLAATAAGRPALCSAILAALLYLPSLGGGFLYDDHRVVLGNRALTEVASPLTVVLSDPTRPLLALGFALNWACSGDRAWSYHLVNLALHAGNSALAAGLFGWMARRRRVADPAAHALLAGALFALTPMAVETVAYVASRSTAQCSLLVLLSLERCLGQLEAESPRAPGWAVASFVLALLTKEEAVSLPLFLLLLDVFHGHLSRSSWPRRLGLHAPFWLILALALSARRALTGAWLPDSAISRLDYALTQLGAFPLYWSRAFLPLDPALYREHPLSTWPPGQVALTLALAGAGLLTAAVVARRRWPDFAFSVLWMAAGLVPSSTLVPLNEMVVDHRAYLGGAGAHPALAGAALTSWPAWGGPALALAFGARASQYEWVLRDPVRAWQDVAARVPRSAMALLNLARAQQQAGDQPGSEATLQRGLELAPGDVRLWTNLGAARAEAGRLPEAAAALRQAVAISPSDPRLRNNYALLLAALGRDDEARQELELVLRSDPRSAQPRVDLARILVKPERPSPEAVARARELISEARRLADELADSPEIEAVAARLRELP